MNGIAISKTVRMKWLWSGFLCVFQPPLSLFENLFRRCFWKSGG